MDAMCYHLHPHHRVTASREVNHMYYYASGQTRASDICDSSLSVASEQLHVTDICGTKESKFITLSGVYFVELDSLANDISKTSIKPLTEKCQNGDHYFAQFSVHCPQTKLHKKKAVK